MTSTLVGVSPSLINVGAGVAVTITNQANIFSLSKAAFGLAEGVAGSIPLPTVPGLSLTGEVDALIGSAPSGNAALSGVMIGAGIAAGLPSITTYLSDLTATLGTTLGNLTLYPGISSSVKFGNVSYLSNYYSWLSPFQYLQKMLAPLETFLSQVDSSISLKKSGAAF